MRDNASCVAITRFGDCVGVVLDVGLGVVFFIWFPYLEILLILSKICKRMRYNVRLF